MSLATGRGDRVYRRHTPALTLFLIGVGWVKPPQTQPFCCFHFLQSENNLDFCKEM